ncbi:hypothetical protein F0562_003182 [Nyssa sinensis]|uniref:Uncharacterized protein n=1 Tax=Nyssa sinensis TaxID=561372 RepID=A0A5J5BUF4_9ASTE|nr:hypothetical protein F0562_003182 [Nyssa sinensis]
MMCQLCGASVGLWTFSTISRPEELLRIVGYSEVNGETASAHHKENLICYDDGAYVAHSSGTGDHVDTREDIFNTAITGATSSNIRSLNLNLTIAGGPSTTKQNFREEISLPVIGWNLKAQISPNSDFRDRPCVPSSIEFPCMSYNISKQNDTLRKIVATYLYSSLAAQWQVPVTLQDRSCFNGNSNNIGHIAKAMVELVAPGRIGQNKKELKLKASELGSNCPVTTKLAKDAERDYPEAEGKRLQMCLMTRVLEPPALDQNLDDCGYEMVKDTH